MAAYVAGNGVTRRRVSLENVKKKGKLYGCNSIYKDIFPDVLVAVDKEQAHAIQESGYALDHDFYTRQPYANKGAKKLDHRYSNWSSGPNAVQLAVQDGHQEIYLFGFDFGSPHGSKFNNIYAGEEFYKDLGDTATFGGNWCMQITAIIRNNPKINFVIVVGGQTAMEYVNRLRQFENVEIMHLREFLIHINNV